MVELLSRKLRPVWTILKLPSNLAQLEFRISRDCLSCLFQTKSNHSLPRGCHMAGGQRCIDDHGTILLERYPTIKWELDWLHRAFYHYSSWPDVGCSNPGKPSSKGIAMCRFCSPVPNLRAKRWGRTYCVLAVWRARRFYRMNVAYSSTRKF